MLVQCAKLAFGWVICTLPCLRCHPLPRLASPRHASPSLAKPALPSLAPPSHAQPSLAVPAAPSHSVMAKYHAALFLFTVRMASNTAARYRSLIP